MNIEFEGRIWYWRGPAPWFFVTVPEKQCAQLRSIQGAVSYGWGMVPVTARIGGTTWTTALFPKDGSFFVPLKASVRVAEKLADGDIVHVSLQVG